MQLEDCYLLGQIRKPHGILGEVKAFFDVDDIEAYEEKESVYVLTGAKLTPFFIENLRIIAPNMAVVKFKGVHTRNDAELLGGLEMYLPTEELPPLREGQFYYHDVIGYTVVDDNLGELGKVKMILEMPGHDLVEMLYKGKQVLIPINDAIVKKANHQDKTLQTALPDGLLEIYLGDTKPEAE